MAKKDYSSKAVQEARKAELQATMEKLEQGVQDVFKGDNFKDYLKFCAKLPKYSLNNQILIMLQMPEATICQSYNAWKAMDRIVKKGETGLRILAPNPFKKKKMQEKLGDDGKVLQDDNGEPIMEQVEVTVMSYRLVSTFDISQTEGKELPTSGVNELMADVVGFKKFFTVFKKVAGVPVDLEEIKGGIKGYFDPSMNRIAIKSGMSDAQTIKTLVHETAHRMLHSDDVADAKNKSRQLKETEAESVAYVVCQHFGIETSDYSFAYVAGWSQGKDMKDLKKALNTIRETAAEIIEKAEDLLMSKAKKKIA